MYKQVKTKQNKHMEAAEDRWEVKSVRLEKGKSCWMSAKHNASFAMNLSGAPSCH